MDGALDNRSMIVALAKSITGNFDGSNTSQSSGADLFFWNYLVQPVVFDSVLKVIIIGVKTCAVIRSFLALVLLHS